MKIPQTFYTALASLNITYAVVDENETIIEHDNQFSFWVSNHSSSVIGHNLFDILPELIGQESLLAKVKQGKKDFIRLENINRVNTHGNIRYLRLTIIPTEIGTRKYLTVFVSDMSGLAEHLQKLTQNRNELDMAKHHLAREKKHLEIANNELQRLNNRFQAELITARKIQQNFLPPPYPNWSGLDVVCYNKSANQVGGDFYTYHAFPKTDEMLRQFAMIIGDVSGKGMSAALLMSASIASLQSAMSHETDIYRILYLFNHYITPYTESTKQNCAMCYVEIVQPYSGTNDVGKTSTIRVINAGGIMPIVRRADNSIEWIEACGLPFGMELTKEWQYHEIQTELSVGDIVILSSDGVVEAKNTSEEIFGFERFENTIANFPQTTSESFLQYLKNEVDTFVGDAEIHDDITIMILQISPCTFKDV